MRFNKMINRKGLGKETKGYKNILGNDSKIHSQSAKGIKQPQKTFNESKLKSMEGENLFKFQDKHQEKIIHSGWEHGNSYRYVLEGTGDIFRELTEREDFIASSYIDEKINRIKNHIKDVRNGVHLETGIHPEDSFEFSFKKNKQKFKQMEEFWDKQPTNTKIQKTAIQLNKNMLNKDFIMAEINIEEIEEYLSNKN